MPENDRIIRRLFRKRYQSRTVRLSEEIANIVIELYEYSEHDADAYADRTTPTIWSEITKRLDEETRKQLQPTFEILDANRFELIWHPAFGRADSAKTKARKLRLAHRGAALDAIDDLDSREYEALGCLLMLLSRASQWHLTPPGNEFGIDFLALLPAFGSSHLFPHAQKQVRIVGQAKKWTTTRVKRSQLDELCVTLQRIRHQHQPLFEAGIFPPWFVAADGLLVGMMLAHRGVQSGGHDVASDHGIILADSRDAAEIVSLSRQWYPEDHASPIDDYLRASVQQILESDE